MKLLLAFPKRRAVPEPVVHARAAHEAQRREPEDGAGAHLFLLFVAAVARAVERSTSERRRASGCTREHPPNGCSVVPLWLAE